MGLPMSRGGYSPTVQMRIGNETMTGLHLVQPQCTEGWRLFGCYSGMAYKLTLQAKLAILRFIAHRVTVTSTSSGSYSNMGRTSAHKMRTARRHYIWHHRVGGSMSQVYCLIVGQIYMPRIRTEGLRCTKRHPRVRICWSPGTTCQMRFCGSPVTKCHLRRKLTWYACCLTVA